ncbi:OmpP1/FadL family transporter [Cruoricaptor ignavus]|uniref:OmpP1/FadL family transporter n=1 Tax=Cruoricaptor ignavus TaxID=1118202 RepID=UPI00370D81BF
MKRILFSIALLSGVSAYAGGFRVSLQGVRQLAMAHTSAHTEDASVAFFHPAGISFIPAKLSVAAGGIGVKNTVTFQNPQTLTKTDTDNPLGTPAYAALAYKLNDKVSLGFSFTTPYGSVVEWPEDWEGREIVQRMELKALYFQPMLAVKLSPEVSVGASYIYSKGLVDWTRAVTLLNGNMNIKDEKAKGHGYGISFYFKPNDKFEAGASYRSPIDMKAKEGVVAFNIKPSVYSVVGLDQNGQDRFTATLPLTEEYTLGLTYRILPQWKVSADLNYHGWHRYSALRLDFEQAPLGNHPEDPTILTVPKNFHNAHTLRIGTEYQFNEKFAGRLGYYFDETPYDDEYFIPETPSFNLHVLTAGFGMNFNGFGLDAAVGMPLGEPRTVNNTYQNFVGEAKMKAIYFGLGLRYNLVK